MPFFSASCVKISRSTTWSLAWASISGPTFWPARAACCSRLSTRALGTALPLTTAMFCACAANGHQQGRRQGDECRTHGLGIRLHVPGIFRWGAAGAGMAGCADELGQARDPGFGSTAGVSSLVGRMRLDGQRVDADRHQQAQRIIHKAMPRHAVQPGKARAGDAHAEMPALARTGMAGMQVAVVLHLQQFRLQGCRNADSMASRLTPGAAFIPVRCALYRRRPGGSRSRPS